jgi:D-alanyl-D-alanine carboxypeptidase
MKTLEKLLLSFILLVGITLTASKDCCAKTKKTKPKAPVYAAFVVDSFTGRVLHSNNAHVSTYPASLTKIMTLYLMFEALESGKLKSHQKLKISQCAAGKPPTKLGLPPGHTITVFDAIMVLMLKSANDIACVVAENLAGTEKDFALLMTEKARQLGMNHTTFKNATGLPDAHQKTTAHDMVILSRAVYQHFPKYYRYFKTRTFKYKGQNLKNHNGLLGAVEGVDGIKTGFINASGWNLAASAVRSGRRIFAVVLGGHNRVWRNKRMTNLINDAFAKLDKMPQIIPLPLRKPMLFANNTDQTVVVLAETKDAIPTPEYKPLLQTQIRAQPNKPSSESNWAIQVGQFYDYNTAHRIAKEAKKRFTMLEDAMIVIDRINEKTHNVRMVGLTKNQATRACRLINEFGGNCEAGQKA